MTASGAESGADERDRSRLLLWTIIPGVIGIVGLLVALNSGDFSPLFKLLSVVTVILAVAAFAAEGYVRSSSVRPQFRGAKLAPWLLGLPALVLVAILTTFSVTGTPEQLAPVGPVTTVDTSTQPQPPSETTQSTPVLAGSIDSPADGETIQSPLEVTGGSNIPPGTSLWLLIQPPSGTFYVTKETPAILDADGGWEFRGVGVGAKNEVSKRRKYELYLVALPSSARDFAKASTDGPTVSFDEMPGQAVILDSVAIYRDATTK